ncbi:cyclic nucleotide-binding domain-containing protein [Synechococcus sp. RSCCF101]|nr:cyclic nucleotide-binding domain-containing protein [Synechococcus sp. RSCCF101]
MLNRAAGERVAFPTGTPIFRQGADVRSIYAICRGVVDVEERDQQRMRYGAGDLFSYQDILLPNAVHTNSAVAATPVELVRVERLNFLNLVHLHPTLVIQLLAQQHRRLREQRANGSCWF